MPSSSKVRSATKRVKVGNIPAKAKKLTKKDARRVKGGILIGLLLPAKDPKPVPKSFTNTTFDDNA